LPHPVTLETVKKEPKLKDMILAHQPRLSVQPVTEAEWHIVRRMGGLK
jgi:predicted RNA-binding protein with PUA-like domain